MTKANDLSAQLIEMSNKIDTAQEELRQGKVANLSNMDAQIAALCDEIIQLPPAEAAEIQPIMGQMIGKLEAYGLALKDFKNSFQTQP